MKLSKPKLEILKRRKKKKVQAKRKKAKAKEMKSQAKKQKAQTKRQKHRLLPRVDGRLERTQRYSATFYYIIMAGVGLIMLMIFLGII